MTIIPQFDLPAGTNVALCSQVKVVNGRDEHGYHLVDMTTGNSEFLSFAHFVARLKLPGGGIDTLVAVNDDRLRQRLGGYTTSKALPEQQQIYGQFHLALCYAMKMLRDRLREERGDPTWNLSIRTLENPTNRKFVQKISQEHFGKKIHVKEGRGGNTSTWTMYRGRTLMKYFNTFDSLHPGENPLDALVRLDHLKGNCSERLCLRSRALMTQACEEKGLDLKGLSVANMHRYLEELIASENQRRARNELGPLIVPSQRTLAAHRDMLMTPTELVVATKGVRYARNTHGRGSTDIRALLVGEFVEIDECKLSLVATAKVTGLWETLSPEDREVLQKVEADLHERFYLLVMIDVASRMPLAWVLSDKPCAEATLALFRMATRDKTREKIIYGCSGAPVSAIGIGHIKNDNGTGLRNSTTVGAMMGMGAMNTIARTYAAADKPYVERMLGTTESVLIKILHGYTGRKAGELPGYDAKENGVISAEELYKILTVFMIDEYPSMRHWGVGMGGRRPYEVYKTLNESRGCIAPIDANIRRISLGWKEMVTPSHEGVRVFRGIWFNSDLLQQELEANRIEGKVSVYVDPDDVSRATVVLPGVKYPVEVDLQITAYADLTVPQVLQLMALWLKEHDETAEIHNDRLLQLRFERSKELKEIAQRHRLARSYSTIEECQKKAKELFRASRVIRSTQLADMTPPGQIANLENGPSVFNIGLESTLIEGQISSAPEEEVSDNTLAGSALAGSIEDAQSGSDNTTARSPTKKIACKIKSAEPGPTLGRPENLKGLE